jgi:cytochrome c-type biogenesis protein CcmH/NrfG
MEKVIHKNADNLDQWWMLEQYVWTFKN